MKNIEVQEKLKQCKYCGSGYGYYQIVKYKGISNYYYDFNNKVIEDGINGDFYEYSDWKEGKTAYCAECNHKLFIIKP